jgi:hypothetical protein
LNQSIPLLARPTEVPHLGVDFACFDSVVVLRRIEAYCGSPG